MIKLRMLSTMQAHSWRPSVYFTIVRYNVLFFDQKNAQWLYAPEGAKRVSPELVKLGDSTKRRCLPAEREQGLAETAHGVEEPLPCEVSLGFPRLSKVHSLSLLSFSYFTRGYASSRRDVAALRRGLAQRRCCRQVQCAPYSRRNVTRNQAGTLAKYRGQSVSRSWCLLICST